MKKEDLKKIFPELTEDQYNEIQRLNGLDVNPIKEQLTTVQTELTTAKKTIGERDTQLEGLKNSNGDIETLKKQIADLQATNQITEQKYQEQLKDLRITSAIKLALNGKVVDEEVAASLFDKSKLIVNEDNSIVGLDDQLKTLQEKKAYLFNQQDENKGGEAPTPGFKFGAENGGKVPTMTEQLNEAFGLK